MYQTPNLSQEFYPQPKPNKKEKAKPKSIGTGKKTEEWRDERKMLVEEFEKIGITSCELRMEGCWGKRDVFFAHLDKRRYLDKADLGQVALLCNKCHSEIELLNRIRMRKILEKVISERNKKLG